MLNDLTRDLERRPTNTPQMGYSLVLLLGMLLTLGMLCSVPGLVELLHRLLATLFEGVLYVYFFLRL